jgi:hypothetical protein
MAQTIAWQHDCPGKLVFRVVGGALAVECQVETEPPPPEPPTGNNLIKNGDFTLGGEHWVIYPKDTVEPSYENGVLHWKVIAPTGILQVFQKNIALTPGQAYRLHFRARALPALSPLTVTIHQHEAPYTAYGAKRGYALTADWENYMLAFTASGMAAPVTDGRLRFSVVNTVVLQEYWIDDVVLQGVNTNADG